VLALSLAGCDGPSEHFSKVGRIVDQQSQAAVAGARVDCLDSEGAVLDETFSQGDGTFALFSEAACAELQVSVPAQVSADHYLPASVPCSPPDELQTIELIRSG
jgi:hypothetical protein